LIERKHAKGDLAKEEHHKQVIHSVDNLVLPDVFPGELFIF
jgi:hypothetical protein